MAGFLLIKSFRCRDTERLFRGKYVRAFSGFHRQAEKRLRILDAAETLVALQALPSNRFESLSGNRSGQVSIRVNLQWRVCFVWNDGAEGVEIIDYH
jgi:proteic killer suppression protein